MEELLLWDKRILVRTTGMVGKAQGPGQTLPPSFGAQGSLCQSPYTMDNRLSKGLQSGCLLLLPSHLTLEAVQRQDSGGTGKEGGVI